MSRLLGSSSAQPTHAVPVPQATRTRSPGWRDPRLWIGVAIVAASVLAGARVLGSADDTVAVWAVGTDAPAGAELSSAGLTPTRVRFADAEAAGRYVSAADEVPPDARLTRDLAAGELLPRSAFAAGAGSGLAELPLDFADGGVAATLRRGDRVDVFVTSPSSDAASATVPLEDVAVLDVVHAGSRLAGSAGVQVILGIGETQRAALPRVVQAAAAGRVYLVARG